MTCVAGLAMAGCGAGSGAGSAVPQTAPASNTLTSPLTTSPQTTSTTSPATGGATVDAAAAASTAITASGEVKGLFSGGFELYAGSTHGYVDVFTTSSTTITGKAPFVGEEVTITGNGSYGTSIDAKTVTQEGSTTSTPAATATPATTTSSSSLGSVVWQAGSSSLGNWTDADTYQCGSPSLSGSQFTFNLKQSGTSCGRNQAQPESSAGSGEFLLANGSTYTWTFKYIDGTPSGSGPGMGSDKEAQSLIWQMHDNGGGCTFTTPSLGFTNNSSGAQVWDFSALGATGSEYSWEGAYTPGESDTFQIQVYMATSGGYMKLWRNGTQVMDLTNVETSGCSTGTWWNFGPYKWRWELSGGGGSSMSQINATIQNMTVYKS
jgi:hypothetical protein